ncbi:hypothetical protein XCR1_1280007 [Xenorhabdus cabanillasii JM26]|uniref:Uncharacterized protein n=1 Tax=Xenorhabdus cabanillasii JM26 TaxID=1427517 RepID=W1IPZ2_9GAMM|nr:hypothetical protein XCR1_1280007 [Xenorhabdus cabanillasii JM26]
MAHGKLSMKNLLSISVMSNNRDWLALMEFRYFVDFKEFISVKELGVNEIK